MRTTSSGSCTIRFPLRLNMTTMVNSSAISVMGLIRGMNFPVVPFHAHGFDADKPGEHAGDEGDAEIDEDAFGDLADADFDEAPGQAEEGGSTVMKNQA